MGMAASQARLLTITARIHDVEYAAQSIQNAKIQLATQSDDVYQNYLAALDATTLTIKDWEGNRNVANFNSLCGINKVDSLYAYSLYDERGRIIVPDDVYKGYTNFLRDCSGLSNDPNAFALYMLDPDNIDNIKALYEDDQLSYYAKNADVNTNIYKYQSAMEEILSNEDNFKKNKKGESLIDDGPNGLTDEKLLEYQALKKKRDYQLFKQYGQTIYEGNPDIPAAPSLKGGIDSFDQEEFNYYATFFKQIQQAGGCVSIAEFNGLNGDAATDSEWLQKMVQAGKITIDVWSVDNKNGELSLYSTGVSSDSCLEYTTTSTIDKAALAKAEAEYEYKTKQIDKKDKQYDNELAKLDTERQALTTEYETLKTVIQDNIKRTFGIFS